MDLKDSISIAVPTLNEEKNLKRCLDSIFRQKYKGRLEVFVIDGGSKDLTLEVAKKYRVKILQNPNKNAESGKMIGFRASSCYYFMILDADMDLVGNNWFNKMLKPLKQDPGIVGSFTRFKTLKTDSFLNQYISLDPIQRDPLFRYLSVDPNQVVIDKKKDYWVCKYEVNKIVPAGFCVYRRKDLLKLKLHKRHKFMELDNLAILVKNEFNYFAYVPSAGIHHPFLKDFKMLVKKRIRNLKEQFFNQPDKREFTWINFENKLDLFKIFLWILYANSLVLPTIVGIIRVVKYKSFIAMLEPIFVWITTNLIILVFLSQKEGRNLILKSLR